MKKLSIILLLFPIFLNAQTWQWAKHVGGSGMDNAFISHIDPQHNIYLFGRYAIYDLPQFNGANCYFDNDTLFGQYGSFIAKYDKNSNLIWVYNLASTGHYVNLTAMEFDSKSNAFFLVGDYYYSVSFPGCELLSSGHNYFIAKIDLNGNCIWSKNIGFCVGVTSIAVDQNGNLFLAGTADNYCTVIDTCHFGGGTYIAKFNTDGMSQWAKTKVARNDNLYFTIEKLKVYNNSLYAVANVAGSNITLTIDTINIQISGLYQFGIGVLCMDSSANAHWLKVDGLPNSGIGPRSMGMNNNGDLYCFARTSDTCIYGNDTVISSGTNQIVAEYDKSGILKRYNHLNFGAGYEGQNSWGIEVLPEGSYYVTSGFSGSANFGNVTLNSISSLDLFIAHFTDARVCLGADHVGGGLGTSIAIDSTGIYVTGIFSPFPKESGSMIIGNNTFTSYGFEDIIFAKHELITGKRPDINKVLIYPNPNNGSFSVIVPIDLVNEENLVMSMYDNLGKLILKRLIAFNEWNPRINISGQATGLYFITVSNGRKTYSGKMIVE